MDVLKIMNFQQLEELTSSWSLGDKFLFTFHFQKWREELNLPICKKILKNVCTPSSYLYTSSSSNPQSQSTLELSDTDDTPTMKVLQILQAHHAGRSLLENSSKEKCLTHEKRNLIVNLIVQHFQKSNSRMSLPVSYKLENEILAMFPKEKLEYYRTERRGKIYAKFYNSKRGSKPVLLQEYPETPKTSHFEFSP